MRIRTWDSAYPNNFVERDLIIDVRRNVYAPRFNLNTINIPLDDTFPSGEIVYNLTASDQDNVRVNFVYMCVFVCVCVCMHVCLNA